MSSPGADVARASGSAPASQHGAPAEQEQIVEDPNSPIRGILLGEYRIRSYHPVEAKRSTVVFRLHAIVSSENSTQFRELHAHRQHKTRDQVIIATRLAPLAEFDDPQLTEFRRRILLRLRRALPELAIDDIFISDFRLEVRDF
jgi:hypothetical protein